MRRTFRRALPRPTPQSPALMATPPRYWEPCLTADICYVTKVRRKHRMTRRTHLTYLDDVARYNEDRWEELATEGVRYARPILDLDAESAREMVDSQRIAGDVAGKDVLCLAAAGGQQSVAFGLLGANVTVLDLTETQLKRDREAATHYGLEVRTVQGDMRRLSAFDDNSFDLLHQAYSINFVPDPLPVFREVVRVLRPGGLYMLRCSNPFVHGLYDRWNGEGYLLNVRYEDAELDKADPHWEFEGFDGSDKRVVGPREFRHTLSTLLNGLAGHRLVLLGLWEDKTTDTNLEPGSWGHFVSVAPPYMTIWAQLSP